MSAVTGDHGIPVRNAWHLLLYAWDLAALGAPTRVAAEQAPSLLGLLASVLADAVDRLLARRLAHRHQPRVEVVQGLRGRIDFGRTLAGLQLQAGRTTCHVSALDLDTLPNRVIKGTLAALARDPRLAPYDPARATALRHRLRDRVDAMGAVRTVPVSAADVARVQLGRSDAAYVLPVAICRLVHHLRLPTEDGGDHAIRALLRDEVYFRGLFERFVRGWCKVHLTGHHVKSEPLQWGDELGSPFVPTMTTDVTLTERAPPHRRLVIDTKYAREALVSSHRGKERFRTANLYQLYAYLRTQEARGPSFATAAGMLLYPTVDRALDEAMRVQGHTIHVVTLDLSRPWPEVEDRLRALVRIGFGDPAP